MIRAKNYQQFSKFVKVTGKILSVPFWGHGVELNLSSRNSNNTNRATFDSVQQERQILL